MEIKQISFDEQQVVLLNMRAMEIASKFSATIEELEINMIKIRDVATKR